MKYFLLGLSPSVLGFAAFWLAYSDIDGWGWFLFGSILLGSFLYDSKSNIENNNKCCGKDCNCN